MIKPGDNAWKRRDYELKQKITADDGTYQKDCMLTMTRYIVSENKVVAQIAMDDLEWMRTFHPSLKPFGALK